MPVMEGAHRWDQCDLSALSAQPGDRLSQRRDRSDDNWFFSHGHSVDDGRLELNISKEQVREKRESEQRLVSRNAIVGRRELRMNRLIPSLVVVSS